ncbi:MAG: dephospho-CoA kinase [Spirochaetaceae bacterium]
MIIALSGKCCSGKNYISSILEDLGYTIIDVDELSKTVFTRSLKEVSELFGDSVIVDGNIDRKKVGDIIFSEPDKRLALENIIHPLVYKEIFNTLDDNPETNFVVNIPLLTDIQLVKRCRGIIWIKSPLLLRIFRAIKRDKYNFITVFKRILAQKKLSVKHFITIVDIYYIKNSWFSNKIEMDLNKILAKLQRG